MPTSAPMCPDWVWSSSSSVSVAKDRGWFTSYTPFTSICNDMAVVGIGTVEIPVRTHSRQSDKKHNILRIPDVLHIPAAICNILGQGLVYEYDLSAVRGLIDREGRVAAYFDDKKRLFCLKLSGPPVGPATTPSLFLKADDDGSMVYSIRANWSAAEHARWQAFKPYTSIEKAWLKQHYKDEYHLLREHGLSIYKDEDREVGRGIVRLLMSVHAKGSAGGEGAADYNIGNVVHVSGFGVYDPNDDDDDDDDANSFLAEIEADPMSHVADYNFDTKQLDWIKKHYTHSANFLLCYGLKPYNDEDCEEGKLILNTMMEDDD